MGTQTLADDGKPVDAILLPPDFVDKLSGNHYWRNNALSSQFAAMLGKKAGEPFHVKPLLKSEHLFLPKEPTDTVLYPESHPLAKKPRYDWRERPQGDGVLYGILRVDPYADLIAEDKARRTIPAFARNEPATPAQTTAPSARGATSSNPMLTDEAKPDGE